VATRPDADCSRRQQSLVFLARSRKGAKGSLCFFVFVAWREVGNFLFMNSL
jgi:hypothetical protein